MHFIAIISFGSHYSNILIKSLMPSPLHSRSRIPFPYKTSSNHFTVGFGKVYLSIIPSPPIL